MRHTKQPDGSSILVVAIALLACAVGYLWLRGAPTDAPRVLLRPIAWISGGLSGTRFEFVAGTGYCGWTRTGRMVIVEKSCSGGNFGVMLFSLLAMTQLPRLRTLRAKLLAFPGLLLFSLAATIAASALRIAASIPLIDFDVGLNPVLLHNLIGIATYLTAICLAYWAVWRFISTFAPERTAS